MTRLRDGHDSQQRLKICLLLLSRRDPYLIQPPTEWVSGLKRPGLQVNRRCLVLRSGRHGHVTLHAQQFLLYSGFCNRCAILITSIITRRRCTTTRLSAYRHIIACETNILLLAAKSKGKQWLRHLFWQSTTAVDRHYVRQRRYQFTRYKLLTRWRKRYNRAVFLKLYETAGR